MPERESRFTFPVALGLFYLTDELLVYLHAIPLSALVTSGAGLFF